MEGPPAAYAGPGLCPRSDVMMAPSMGEPLVIKTGVGLSPGNDGLTTATYEKWGWWTNSQFLILSWTKHLLNCIAPGM